MPEVIDGTTSIPELIREFGTENIPFVHFRDVKGTVDHFQETFHDAGQTDMPACMDAYYDIGFEGAMRPDHVPTLAGELEHPARVRDARPALRDRLHPRPRAVGIRTPVTGSREEN